MNGQALSLGVVILAAGASQRMGRPKMLLPWGNTSVIGHIVEQWGSLRAQQIAVVCRPGDQKLQDELRRLGRHEGEWIINHAAEQGMFGSIQIAARWDGWRGDLTHIAIALGDQPQIRTDTLAMIIHFAAQHSDSICQPSFQGRPKHPVVMSHPVFLQLARTSSGTLRDFLEANGARRRLIEIEDAGLNFDLDAPDDYARALKQFGAERR